VLFRSFVSLSGEPGNQELTSFIGILADNERLDVLTQIQEIYEQLKSKDVASRRLLSAVPFLSTMHN